MLNYRIERTDLESLEKSLEDEALDDLLALDQLRQQCNQGLVILGFIECWITFRPTYEFDPRISDWNSESILLPAWTHKVLWRGEHIEQTFY